MQTKKETVKKPLSDKEKEANDIKLNKAKTIIVEPRVFSPPISTPYVLRVRNTNEVVSKVTLFGEGIYKGLPNNGSDEGVKISIQNGFAKYESLLYFVSLNPSILGNVRINGNIKNIKDDFIHAVTLDYKGMTQKIDVIRPYLYKDSYQFQNDIIEWKPKYEVSAFQGFEFNMMPNCELQFAFYPIQIQLLKNNS